MGFRLEPQFVAGINLFHPALQFVGQSRPWFQLDYKGASHDIPTVALDRNEDMTNGFRSGGIFMTGSFPQRLHQEVKRSAIR